MIYLRVLDGAGQSSRKDIQFFCTFSGVKSVKKASESPKIEKRSFSDNPGQRNTNFWWNIAMSICTTSEKKVNFLKRNFVVIYHCDLSMSLEPWALGWKGENHPKVSMAANCSHLCGRYRKMSEKAIVKVLERNLRKPWKILNSNWSKLQICVYIFCPRLSEETVFSNFRLPRALTLIFNMKNVGIRHF